VLLHYRLYPTKLGRSKSKILSQRDRVQPELCGFLVPIYVHMRRFIWLVTIEIESVRPGSEYGRHSDILKIIYQYR